MRDTAQTRNFGWVSNVEKYKELILPSLQETRTVVTLAPAKPAGLADLGVPLVDTTMVKKGRAHEYPQLLTDGKIGRRFQDLRVIGIKTVEAGVPSANCSSSSRCSVTTRRRRQTGSVSKRLSLRARSNWPACHRAACSYPTPIFGIQTASCSRCRWRTSIKLTVWNSSRSPRRFALSS